MQKLPGKFIASLFAVFANNPVTPPAADLEAPGDETVIDNTKLNNIHHVFTFDTVDIGTDVIVGIFGKANGEADASQVSNSLSTIDTDDRFSVKIANTPLSEVSLRLVTVNGGNPKVNAIQYIGSK